MCAKIPIMRILSCILLLFICCVLPYTGASALDVYGATFTNGDYVVNEDVTIHHGAAFEAHNLKISDSLRIINDGEISGGVDVCAGCTMELQNSGVFDADVLLQSGAHLVQVITENDEITDIGMSSGFEIVVRDGIGISLNQLKSLLINADSVDFENTRFDAGNMSGYSAINDVSLAGDLIIQFDDVSESPLLLFADATGDGVVHVASNALDNLHAFQTYWSDNDVFVRIVRTTDYARILNNNMGVFLNDLRKSGRDDKLLMKLDSAKSMSGINHILNRSVRTNPIKLMQPVSVMESYESLEIMHIDNEAVGGVKPFAIYSSDVFIYGIRPSVSFNVSDDLHMKLSGYVADINRADGLNEYTGVAFGLGANAQYDMDDNNFVRAHIGANKTFFDIAPVFDGTRTVRNPGGYMVDFDTEYGHIFDIGHGYKLSPFAGIGTEYVTVAGLDDTSIYGVSGTDVGYEYEFGGLRYGYSGRVLARTDGLIGIGGNFSVWSGFDAAGADVHIAVIRDDVFGVSCAVSLNGRFMF